MAERSVVLRLATKDGELVKRALTSLGAEGEAALKRLERAGQPASRALKAVDAAAGEAKQSVENLAQRAGAGSSVLRALGPAGLAAAAGIGALVIAFGAVMAKAREAVDYFDDLQDAADRLGVGTEWLQGIRFSVGQAGGDIEKTEAALDRLNAVLGDVARGGGGEAAKAFKQLGVNVLDAQGNVKSLERVLPEFADGYSRLADAQQRASVATDLFGRGNQAFARILVDGAAGLERQIQLAREMGAVVDAEIVKKGAEAKDRLEALALVIKAQLYTAVIDAVPAIVSLAEAFAAAARWAGATADAWNDLPDQRLVTLRSTLKGLQDELQRMKDSKTDGSWFPWSDEDIAKQEALVKKYEDAIAARNYQDFEGRRATGMTAPDPKTLSEYTAAVQQVIDDLKVQEDQARRTGEALAVYNALLKVPDATLKEREAITKVAIETFRAEEAKRQAEEAARDAKRDADKAVRDAEREHQQLLAEGERVTTRLATAEEKRAAALAEIAKLQNAGAIDAPTAERARRAAELEYFNNSTGVGAGLVQGLDQLVTMTGDAAGQISDLLTSAFSGIEDAFVQFVRTGKLSFKSLVDSMLEDLARLAARTATNALLQGALNVAMAAFGSPSSGISAGAGLYGPDFYNAKGNVFDQSGIRKFGTGDIVDRATLFGYGRNRIGVMGEAGTEGIFPLRRDSAGRLGVSAVGAGGGSPTTIAFSPVISIPPGTSSADMKAYVDQSLARSYERFKAEVPGIIRQYRMDSVM